MEEKEEELTIQGDGGLSGRNDKLFIEYRGITEWMGHVMINVSVSELHALDKARVLGGRCLAISLIFGEDTVFASKS